MRLVINLMLLLFSVSELSAQDLPGRVTEQPDGITISYFNSNADTCLPRIFIGDSLQILFPCYSKRNYQRIDISSAKMEISRLKQLLTTEFVLKLNSCRGSRGDTDHGYYLMLKKEGKDVADYLDIAYTSSDKCGSRELTEIIELLNKINMKYR